MNIQDITQVEMPDMSGKYPTKQEWEDAITGSFSDWCKKWKNYHMNDEHDCHLSPDDGCDHPSHPQVDDDPNEER